MSTPQSVAPRYTLPTAVARLDELRLRGTLAGGGTGGERPGRTELLELLALGEAVARKAAEGRRLAVRAAREAGASWAQIGAALGTDERTARQTYERRNGTGEQAGT